ncbi:MAG: site-specific DNA-methyltransferase [Candidatus Hermodarchaeota archaeon]
MNWSGKQKGNDFNFEIKETVPCHIVDAYSFKRTSFKLEDQWKNLLILGENKLVMQSLLKTFKNKINLIYIDPPFATGGEFNLKIQIGKNGDYFDNIAYKDKWKEGIDSYLNFLYERLVLMKELLSDNGSIYVHLDWHISHYIKLIMDEIFGNMNFRNEIIWAYPAASVKTRRFFIRSYDTILFYSKSDDYIFNDHPKIYQEFSQRVKNAIKKDEKGIFYYRGGSHDGKKLSRKVYIEKEGIFPRDLWNDIPYIRANTPEYQGFSTQKPERLLSRIILASSNKGDIVADFFCGSGTTLTVAEKLGRRWIGCDSKFFSIHMIRKRMLDIYQSNDILNWKKLYSKDPNSFKILSSDQEKEGISIPNVFLIKGLKDKKLNTFKESPDFNVNINQHNNKVKVELIDYKIPFEKFISEKIKEKIKSFTDWIDYWSIDFDYKDFFENIWYSYRTPKKRILSLESETHQYVKSGNYNVSVKIIDILGIETRKSYKINII